MKRFISLLLFIPFITFAQPKKTNSTKPPLIESITSDTIKGVYNQVLFSYDESNRVIGITYKDCRIATDSAKTKKLIKTISEQQTFEYQGSSIQPYLRTNLTYEYIEESKNWILSSIEKNYFFYKNGQRAGDSSLFLSNGDNKQDLVWEDNKASTNVSKLEKTKNRMYQKDDYTNPSTHYPNIYISEIKLTPSSNISYELFENHYGGRGLYAKYSSFTKFDSKLNPLKQLNITNALCNENISFYISKENANIDDPDVIKTIKWYFFNHNNMLDYYETFDERHSSYKDIFNVKYNYNQYNLPVYVKVLIKQVSRNASNDDKQVHHRYQKSFTFRYKQSR